VRLPVLQLSYNYFVLKSICFRLVWLGVILCLASPEFAQNTPTSGHTLLIFPFENTSGAPGLEWIGESFPELLGSRLASASLYVLSREERLRAYDRANIPPSVRPSRATLYRIAEQMDVDYAVMGQFGYDGKTFSSSAQLLDMRALKLLPATTVSGALVDLINIQTGLAWDLLHGLRPELSITRDSFVASGPAIRLDAFENYIRGVIAGNAVEKIAHLREAVRLKPDYNDAWLQLGKTYFDERRYELASAALAHIPQTIPSAQEANFFLGLASYYQGEFAKAESAFSQVASRMPLPEVYNNLGVALARLGKKDAARYFQRALQDDPNDADYHFNLAIELYRAGDLSGSLRQLSQSLALRRGDTEAKAFSDRVTEEQVVSGQITTPRTGAFKPPLERIKRNYDENLFRLMALQIQALAEQRWAKNDPRTHASFHVGRGDELLSQGFVSEAEREYREAVSLDSGNAQAHAGLARVLENNADANGARMEAEQALRLKQFAEPLLVMARLDLRDNKPEEAAETVNRALQLEPANASAQALKRAVAAKLAEKAQPLPSQ